VKVRADLQTRSHVLETVNLFRAKVVDVAPDAVTIEVTGNPDKLEAFLGCSSPSASASWCSPAWSASAAGTARSPTARCAAPEPPSQPEPAPSRPRTTFRERFREGAATVAEMYYDDDADLSVITGRQVGRLGYGSQATPTAQPS
jgi:hypothetical protein